MIWCRADIASVVSIWPLDINLAMAGKMPDVKRTMPSKLAPYPARPKFPMVHTAVGLVDIEKGGMKN